MKKKELKKIAEQIIEYENIIANPEASDWDKRCAKEEIINLSGKITSLDDMTFIDDYIQEYMQKN